MCSLFGVSGCFLNLNYCSLIPFCPPWHEISTSQGPDWPWLTDLLWASVKQMACFYVCAHACGCVCVNLSVQRYQRKQMQSRITSGVSLSSVFRAACTIAGNCCNKQVQDICKKCLTLHRRGGVIHVTCDLFFVESECLPFCSFLELAQVKFKLSQNENPFCTNVQQFQWNESPIFYTANIFMVVIRETVLTERGKNAQNAVPFSVKQHFPLLSFECGICQKRTDTDVCNRSTF